MIIGIDPGKSGAVAWMKNDGTVGVIPTPETEGDIVALFIDVIGKKDASETVTIYLEQLNGFAGGKGQPGSMMFVMAKYYWCWIFLAAAFNVRLHLVTPQKWQKDIGIGTRGSYNGKSAKEMYQLKKEWKNKLKAEAQRIYPMVDRITLETADALMILEYGRKSNLLPEPKFFF